MTEADDKIEGCLKTRRSFLVDAGAGSGKTSSLIRALTYIRSSERAKLVQNSQRVACITYTNVAKDEIIERTERDSLFDVSTIHEFLWRVIQPFQVELKSALLTFNEELPDRSRRKHPQAELKAALLGVRHINYSDRGANFLEGRIFHDDLLGVGHIMFRDHQALSKIVASMYPFIFVDEYQDTNPKVISILMEHLIKTERPPVVGFFGDKMQSIYNDVVGEMPNEHEAVLERITKKENYRCSKAVIELLNKIRSDIRQVPAGNNVDGAAIYLNLAHVSADKDDVIEAAIQALTDRFGWRLGSDLKILFLTHRIIAKKAGYEDLWNIYNDREGFARERFQAGQDEIATFFRLEVEPLIVAWREGNEGLAISHLCSSERLLAKQDVKLRLHKSLDDLVSLTVNGATIGDVLRHISSSKLIPLLEDLEEALHGKMKDAEVGSSEADYQTFLTKLLAIDYRQMTNYRMVFEDHLPFSTKHGVKGAEFENVFVILDDVGANWNQYSFRNLLAGADTSSSRLSRTRNLFYVCCSRARNRLAVIDLAPVGAREAAIRDLFGENHVAI